MEEMTQANWSDYLTISRDELIEQLRAGLSEGRFQHVLRVEEEAVKLAHHFGKDPLKVSIAGLLHDYAKEMPSQEMFTLAHDYWDDGSLREGNEGVWHGLAAATIAKKVFNCQDQEILDAVAFHPTGWYHMTDTAKILYLADYIEAGRDFKGVNKMRKIAYQDLDQACFDKIRMSTKHMMKKEIYIYPLQIYVYNVWNTRFKESQKI